jgi:hypothetical protein
MAKRYTALAQVFKAIVEALSDSYNPSKRYVVPPEFEELFKSAFPDADGNPGGVEDSFIDEFVAKEVLISKKISLTAGESSGGTLSQLEDLKTRLN